MFFQRVYGSFAINKRNSGVTIEKGNDRAGTAGHGQCANTDNTAAEKADDNTGAVAENTAPFIGNMPIAAMFQNPRDGIVGAKADIGTKIKRNAQTGDENTGSEKTNTAGYGQCFRKTDRGK